MSRFPRRALSGVNGGVAPGETNDFEGLVRDGLARRGEPDKDDDSESKRIDRPADDGCGELWYITGESAGLDVSDRWDGLPDMSSRPSCRTTRESNSSTSRVWVYSARLRREDFDARGEVRLALP